ncbi:unnamed protein product [Prorocentrum cordatum]|uniref:Uncharacterized protein n=1 Tax=Prorocentrum cordatum TaxID=2364126 RepID=A0ABN9VPR8_9DINO|nr:unnamed protein product [Polarella glacialis]
MVNERRSEPELVLQRVPDAIMVKIPGSTAPRFGNQPAGVFPVERKKVSWDRSPGFKAMVKRAGFPLVPQFAAAAHFVTTAILPQAIIDLLDARATPRASMVPTGYAAVSRAWRVGDLIITQFFPHAVPPGAPDGPAARSRIPTQPGEMTAEQTRAGWAKAEKEAASRSPKELAVASFWRGDCHQRKEAGDFPGGGMSTSDYVEHAVARGGVPERCERGQRTSLARFRFGEVNVLNARGDLDRAVCIGCAPGRPRFKAQLEVRLFRRAQCAAQKLKEEFDETFLKQHRSANDMICAACVDAKMRPLRRGKDGRCGARPPGRSQNGREH